MHKGKCLKLNIVKSEIGVKGEVLKKFEEMQDLVRKDEDNGWSQSQLQLLSYSKIPLIAVLAINSAYSLSVNLINLDMLAEELMLEILSSYFDDSFFIMNERFSHLKRDSGFTEILKDFTKMYQRHKVKAWVPKKNYKTLLL